MFNNSPEHQIFPASHHSVVLPNPSFHKKSISLPYSKIKPLNHDMSHPKILYKKRFPYEIFSAGSKSHQRSKRKIDHIFGIPESENHLPMLPSLKCSVNFEEMEKLKNECKQIINGGPINYGCLQQKYNLSSMYRKGPIILSPINMTNIDKDKETLTIKKPAILPIPVLHEDAPSRDNFSYSLRKEPDIFRKTAFFKSVIENSMDDIKKHETNEKKKLYYKNSRIIEGGSAPSKKTQLMRIKLEREILKKDIKLSQKHYLVKKSSQVSTKNIVKTLIPKYPLNKKMMKRKASETGIKSERKLMKSRVNQGEDDEEFTFGDINQDDININKGNILENIALI